MIGEGDSFHVKHCANYPCKLKRTLSNRVIGPDNSAIHFGLRKVPCVRRAPSERGELTFTGNR